MSGTGNGGSRFGGCCEALKEVLTADDFDPLIAEAEDGILYMSIGMLEAESGQANVVDHPVFFCPFCGNELQTEAEVEAKSGETEQS